MAQRSDRRTFIASMAGTLALPILGQPLAGCAYGFVKGEDGPSELLFDISAPEFVPLAEVGGMVPVQLGRRALLLIRTHPERVMAFDRNCTHETCDLSPDDSGLYDIETETIVCTCHWTGYGLDGSVKYGPAKRALPVFPVEFDAIAGSGVVMLRVEAT